MKKNKKGNNKKKDLKASKSRLNKQSTTSVSKISKKRKVKKAPKQRNKKSFVDLLKQWRQKKSFGITVICVATVLLFTLGIFLIFSPPKTNVLPRTEFYPADYSYNIFKNTAYMSMERDLLYRNGNFVKRYNYEKDFKDAKPECQFFLEYFNTAINGDYQS